MTHIMRLFISFIVLLVASSLFGQGVTKVSGRVYEAETGDPLAFVNVIFKGTSVGSPTDLDGYFEIQSRFVSDSLCANFLGFNEQCIAIDKETKHRNVDFRLEAKELRLKNVTVVAKKGRYRKKNNPAVELMRKVIANKKDNRLESEDFYTFEQHEKIQIDLNNVTEEFKDRKIFNNFDLLWNYLDTSNVNGKVFLPIFLREVISDVYYRKSSKTKKEYQKAIKLTKFDEQLDDQSINDVIEFLYKDIDIYDNTIPLLDHSFISPISHLALNCYRFYILDTTNVNGINSTRLGFIPKNMSNFGFTGDLYVTNDERHTVTGADFGIIGDINLNFINDLELSQDFEPLPDHEDRFVLTKDEIVIDYSLTRNGIGLFGTRTLGYKAFDFAPPDQSVFSPIDQVIKSDDAFEHGDSYWDQKRIIDLNDNQEELYEMIDTRITIPAYKRLVTGIRILSTGYVPLKKFEIGPLPTFYSYNQVEGSRVRLGGETNLDFNKKIQLQGYGAYGIRDERFKYSGAATYSFNKDWKRNPRHFVRATYQSDVSFPGQELTFAQQDNILLSLRRGQTNFMFLDREAILQYTRETPGFAYDIIYTNRKRQPYGDLELNFVDELGEPGSLSEINTTTLGVSLEYAPNKQFIQGRQYRRPIINKFPIWTLRYEGAIDGFLGSEFSYQKLELGVFKRFNLSVFGHTNIGIEVSKIWGDLPYTELFIPPANQSFAYQRETFNLMNFFEFVSDQQIFIRAGHYFKGFFFNRVPLLKKLKLREVATFKMVYGSLSDANNPLITEGIPLFNLNQDGERLTNIFDDGAYIEGSVGLTNIFKVLRLDLVKRFSYLDNPNIPTLFGTAGLGIRARFKVEF